MIVGVVDCVPLIEDLSSMQAVVDTVMLVWGLYNVKFLTSH
jgi:hypothetical protein